MTKAERRRVLDEFGEYLIFFAYDRACSNLQTVVMVPDDRFPGSASEYAAQKPKTRQLVQRCLRDGVNAGLTCFLANLHHQRSKLMFRSDEGVEVDIRALCKSLGEEIGVLLSTKKSGWIDRFSKFTDPIEPLRTD